MKTFTKQASKRGFWKQMKAIKQRMEKFNCTNGSNLLAQIWLFQFLEGNKWKNMTIGPLCYFIIKMEFHNNCHTLYNTKFSIFSIWQKRCNKFMPTKVVMSVFWLQKLITIQLPTCWVWTSNCHTLQKILSIPTHVFATCVQINHFYNCWCVTILHGTILKQLEIAYTTTKWF
jgi:hypothetical protein